jgi:uncharacterized protein YjiS (DUF1127 family)
MTMITYHQADSPSRLRLYSPSWLLHVTAYAGSLLASWRRRQTLRMLESLPQETLKDIGWPTAENPHMRVVKK